MDSFIGTSNMVGDEESENTEVSWRKENSEPGLAINDKLSKKQNPLLTTLIQNFSTIPMSYPTSLIPK